MATNPKEATENDRIRDVIRQLHVALEQCHKLLDDTEAPSRQFTQDNDPK